MAGKPIPLGQPGYAEPYDHNMPPRKPSPNFIGSACVCGHSAHLLNWATGKYGCISANCTCPCEDFQPVNQPTVQSSSLPSSKP